MDELVKAIAGYLKSLYDPIKIYTEEIPQGAPAEYFFVRPVAHGRNHVMGRRYEQTFSLDILFDAKQNKRLWSMAASIDYNFRYLPVGGSLIRPIDLNQNVTDGILHTIVDFNIHVFEETTLWPQMQEMLSREGIRNG